LLLKTAISEVEDILKPIGQPVFRHTRMWQQAIPQYNVGYSSVLEEIEKTEAANPGLHILGNYRGGISMGACIRNATELAKRLV
jgi:oxygen-dependent protoporphyrinogen oxidase